MEWKFEKYGKDSTRQDSSSDKFFNDATSSDSLIREFIQNSLDAVCDTNKPVKVIINNKLIKKEILNKFFDNLKPHLRACKISENNDIQNCVILEDFNTKGLEGDHKSKFFHADNITNKTEGGGSHGIGKAVFPRSSKIKAFLSYSLFGEGEKVFQGRSVLKTHKINEEEFRPYGDLIVDVKDCADDIQTIFKRKAETGLSVMIPACDIDIEELKKSCLRQFYIPIIDEKLEIQIGETHITADNLLDCIDPSNFEIKYKIELATDYSTAPNNTVKEYKISEPDWMEGNNPKLEQKLLKTNPLFIKFKIDLPVKTSSKKYGFGILLIKKLEESIKNQKIDCWRDNLLISSALGNRQTEQEYSAIFWIKDKELSQLLRSLEDPGHTKWQTNNIKDDNELLRSS